MVITSEKFKRRNHAKELIVYTYAYQAVVRVGRVYARDLVSVYA